MCACDSFGSHRLEVEDPHVLGLDTVLKIPMSWVWTQRIHGKCMPLPPAVRLLDLVSGTDE